MLLYPYEAGCKLALRRMRGGLRLTRRRRSCLDGVHRGSSAVRLPGFWYAWPSTHPGFELVAAGMLIMAGGRDPETDGL
jgi:hypothetical protein